MTISRFYNHHSANDEGYSLKMFEGPQVGQNMPFAEEVTHT